MDWVDVVAERGGVRLIGEAKGITTSPVLDVDTMIGQPLRRMTDEDPAIRYALIVPDKVVPAVLRVPERIRQVLRIDVFGVAEDGWSHVTEVVTSASDGPVSSPRLTMRVRGAAGYSRDTP